MKRSKHAALTAAVFAAALGASASGSIPADAVTQRYLSAAGQRTMQLLYGPEAIYSPLQTGDINDDGALDARDLTLLKRKLLSGPYPALSGVTHYYNFQKDSFINGTDARALVQHLTGEEETPQHPAEFIAFLVPLPYLTTAIPDNQAERTALEMKAEQKLSELAVCECYISSSGQKLAAAPEQPDDTVTDYFWLGAEFFIRIPDGFVPNTEETADGRICRKHISELCLDFAFDHYSYEERVTEPNSPDSDKTDMQIEYIRHYTGTDRSSLRCPVVTFESVPGQEDVYYDKCVIEWDVNTNDFLVHESQTMDTDYWEAVDEILETYYASQIIEADEAE